MRKQSEIWGVVNSFVLIHEAFARLGRAFVIPDPSTLEKGLTSKKLLQTHKNRCQGNKTLPNFVRLRGLILSFRQPQDPLYQHYLVGFYG